MKDFLARLLTPRSPAQLARAVLRRIPGGLRVLAAVRLLQRLRWGPDARWVHRRRTARLLAGFLAGGGRLALPVSPAPEVSILLVLFNQAAMTLACLRSIVATVDVLVEVIIVDNASDDQTAVLLDRLDGARILRNAENRHFLHAVNQAAAVASGTAILLLNNDAMLRPGSLRSAWCRLMQEPQAGAVGGPIVLPDGRLQEAGSIIFADGTCLGYGRSGDPRDGSFGFVREVDYCSGAFLLVRRAVFAALGGFDVAYAPAYYEETDFCMRLRDAGYRVVYDPLAVIDHFEFASAASRAGAVALQQRNHTIFRERHQAALQRAHHAPGTSPLVARMRDGVRGRVLLIEDRVPYASLGTGYPRSARLLQTMLADGWFVTLYPLVFPDDDEAVLRAAFGPQVEVMLGSGAAGLAAFLQARSGYYDFVLVCRPHNMERFLQAGGRAFAKRLVYDAEAVFAEREIAWLVLQGKPPTQTRATALRDAEMQLALAADAVLAVSQGEAGLFRAAGCRDVRVLSHAIALQSTQTPWASRRDLLFVGALHEDRSPNVDGLQWFVASVMPCLDALIGTDWRLHVVGRADSPTVQALAGPRILLPGRVADLRPLYAASRIFVAPMRYAGGIPLKVVEAAAHGVPVVATALLARQLGWRNEGEVLTGDTPAAFAAACARLYQDEALWWRVRSEAAVSVQRDFDAGAFTATIRAVLAA